MHDGVMFLADPGDVVQALDAATGGSWKYFESRADYGRQIPRQTPTNGFSIRV